MTEYFSKDTLPVQETSPLSGNTYNFMTLNLDSSDRGVVVMVSWVDKIQFRFKLDSQVWNVLSERGHNPDTYLYNVDFMWPKESDLLFTAISDFRATLFHRVVQSNSTTTCNIKTVSCVKVPDLFNIMQETLQHIYNIYTAYVPVLPIIYPNSNILYTLNKNPILFSVVLPVFLCAAVFLFVVPFCALTTQFLRKSNSKENVHINLEPIDNPTAFRDFCDCAGTENTIKNHKIKRKKTKEEKLQCLFIWSLGIFSFIFVFIYPFSVKVTKSIVKSIFEDSIANSNEDDSSWLVVAYKFSTIFCLITSLVSLPCAV
jgi:hypothetical protein